MRLLLGDRTETSRPAMPQTDNVDRRSSESHTSQSALPMMADRHQVNLDHHAMVRHARPHADACNDDNRLALAQELRMAMGLPVTGDIVQTLSFSDRHRAFIGTFPSTHAFDQTQSTAQAAHRYAIRNWLSTAVPEGERLPLYIHHPASVGSVHWLQLRVNGTYLAEPEIRSRPTDHTTTWIQAEARDPLGYIIITHFPSFPENDYQQLQTEIAENDRATMSFIVQIRRR
jgi:hypothetical protein